MKKRWLWALPVVVLLLPCCWWVYRVNATEFEARTTVHEVHLPVGFTGWATIKFGVTSAPALKVVQNGLTQTTVFPIPASGLLETSTPMYRGHYTPTWYRSDRGGAVLMKFDPPPFFLREVNDGNRCFHVFVPAQMLPMEQESPPIPDRGC